MSFIPLIPPIRKTCFTRAVQKNINEASKRLRAIASNKWILRPRAILARLRKTSLVSATARQLPAQAISEMPAGIAFGDVKGEKMTRKDLFATMIVGLMTVTAAYAADAPAASAPADLSAKPPKAKKIKSVKNPTKSSASASAKAPAAEK